MLIKAQGGFPEADQVAGGAGVRLLRSEHAGNRRIDLAAANKILDDAGYATGGDGIRDKDGKRLSYTFMVQAGRADDELAQQVIIAQLKAIGIEATADNQTGVAYREARYKGGYDLIYGRWITSADPVYSVFWGTGGANNGQSYSNPELDAAFAEFENTLDPAERKAAAAEVPEDPRRRPADDLADHQRRADRQDQDAQELRAEPDQHDQLRRYRRLVHGVSLSRPVAPPVPRHWPAGGDFLSSAQEAA